MVLRDLAVRLDGLSPADRKAAHGILARPATDQPTAPGGWSDGEVRHSPDCGPNVCIHWASGTGGDAPAATDTDPANGIPDYVDQPWPTAENVWDSEVDHHGLPGAALRR